ncbi:DUF2127 domain-containing protein [Candidatus Nitrospira inopinata]|jgi:uncharacterized membrane protein (DUF2068 family)|uniref:DUF2127 domain-containing protein n=1 Tax=Candidatus Nitrospira inopinata TaxID=1715989 RepID=A0A0S4KTX4_9BACT|nr:DUF2127 domain-containing protein [Candidatus Nitrospira inopinata]CUQ65787.1 conserved membrane protein of unknown function [Candidatus Nitrospira inopinata]
MTAHSHQTGLAVIALFKVVKGLLLLMVGLGLLELMHADLATLFSRLIEALHLNADSRIIHALVLRIDALQPHSVLVASLVSLGYAGLFLVEGIGLWFERSWAAYLTVVSTSLLVPFEVYEVIERVSILRVGVLLLNLLIVLYLVVQLKRHTLNHT